MNAFKYLLLLIFLTPLYLDAQVQNNTEINVQISKEKVNIKGIVYYLHTVRKGENLYRISKAYNISQKDIIISNPEAFSGSVQEGATLKIPVNPSSIKNVSQIEDEKFIRHIVEDGQTLFFLTQKYKISKEELYKYNPELEVSPLQPGQVVSIPKNVTTQPKNVNVTPEKPVVMEKEFPKTKEVVNKTPVYNEYKVKRKETKYSITKQFQITMDELIAANPILNSEDLKVGQMIQIPVKEGVLFVKKTEEVQEAQTPEKVKLPTPSSLTAFSESYNVALFIPFFLDENETISMVDSIANMSTDNDKRSETNEIFQRTQNFIEFYQGALLAIDSLKKCGLKVKVFTYDTGRDTLKINKILRKPELAQMDLIIGPFYADPAERVARYCLANKIKMVSPVSNNTKILKNNPYVFEVIPTEDVYFDATLNYIETISNRQIIFIQSDRNADKHVSELYRQKLDSRHIPYKFFRYNDNSNQLNTLLSSSKENIVIFPTEDEGLLSIIFPILNKQVSKDSIQVFGLPICVKFRNVDLDYFYNLEFHYCSTFFADFNRNKLLPQFLTKYKTYNYGEPYFHSRENYPYLFTKEGYNFAYLGYDITFYFLNNLGRNGKNFENYLYSDKSSLLHSSFNFERWDAQSGYINKGVNIIHYTHDFNVEKISDTTHLNMVGQSSSAVMKK